jgi:negative regulator of flagellin synthesis FlgM
MSIEINGSSNRPPAGTSETSATGRAKHAPSSTASSGARGGSRADTFSLTNRASQLQQLEAQIANLPVVDTQRVTEVQHALATGTLEIRPAEIAEKLLNFEAGLAPSGKR